MALERVRGIEFNYRSPAVASDTEARVCLCPGLFPTFGSRSVARLGRFSPAVSDARFIKIGNCLAGSGVAAGKRLPTTRHRLSEVNGRAPTMTKKLLDEAVVVLALYAASAACWVCVRRRRAASAHAELQSLFLEASAHPEDLDALREKLRAIVRDRRASRH